MKNRFLLWALPILMAAVSCQQQRPEGQAPASTTTANPAAPGFNAQGSDPAAIALADEVMAAMGGRKAWDETRYLHWNFFGRRSLLWDKYTGDVRITFLPDSNAIVLNINSPAKGAALMGGQLVSSTDSLQALLQQGKSIWINDAYWLAMPFKLKDSGVTLKHLGTDTTQAGAPAQKLQLTFEKVGDTPQNKYEVWVSDTSKRVVQWAYFATAEDPAPAFITPWSGYEQQGSIFLSGGRGERSLTEIKVLEEVPQAAFQLP